MKTTILYILLTLSLVSLGYFIQSLRETIKAKGLELELAALEHNHTRDMLSICKGELSQYIRTAWNLNDENRDLRDSRVRLRKQHTEDCERIDSLMHGERSCILGHRYYRTESVSCPHCGAAEAVSGPRFEVVKGNAEVVGI